jgi:hypothetical protein
MANKITLDQALNSPRDIGLDLETTGLQWWKDEPLICGLANRDFSGYFDFREYSFETLKQV